MTKLYGTKIVIVLKPKTIISNNLKECSQTVEILVGYRNLGPDCL